MLVAQRRRKIKETLLKDQSVKVADLVREFNVSEETIRRDLNELEREGIAVKNYGGAVLSEDAGIEVMTPQSIDQRRFHLFDEKDVIGHYAANLVADDQVVILDAGSTTWCVARHLKKRNNLTVVTNGINVAEELSQSESPSIFVVGGKLNKNLMSLVSPQPEIEIQKYNADIVILGASGISLRKGFTSLDVYEAEVKKAMVNAGQKVVIVADHSKIEKQGLISFSSFRDVDTLVTSSLANEEILREIEKQGVEIVVCPIDVANRALS